MSRQDPGAASGVADYPPPQPRCCCGAIHGVHELRNGVRGGCPHTGCKRYEPDEAAEVGR